ncbi:MAG TPA: SapC family protein [Ideonella sp.]|nr:SapC family protein [Ideonella sp.]
MINPDLHKKPATLDRVSHRNLKLREDLNTLHAAAGLNSFFVTVAEFGDACREYPILFLRAGTDAQGKPQVAPVAVFGLSQGENLFLPKDATGALPASTRWQGRYVPAALRAYPFTMAKVDETQLAMCIDESWAGWSQEQGRALFDEKGEATPFLEELRKFTEQIEIEIERTRLAGQTLMEMGLLQDRRFDATLPDGSPLAVEGFMALDEKRYAELTDAEVLTLHKRGLFAVLHLHQISLGNMRWLLERRLGSAVPV